MYICGQVLSFQIQTAARFKSTYRIDHLANKYISYEIACLILTDLDEEFVNSLVVTSALHKTCNLIFRL